MPLTMYVDGARWRDHLQQVRDAHPGLVPVVKGNGYGFGIERLAERSAWLGVDTVAVGTYREVVPVAAAFGGSVLVLTPWRPFETRAVLSGTWSTPWAGWRTCRRSRPGPAITGPAWCWSG